MSTLFWINILIGLLLGLGTLAMAPAIAEFFHEPQLYGITAALASGFLFNAAGTQHLALLQREMRFTALAIIGVVSSIMSTVVAIAVAIAGYGLSALVAISIIGPLIFSVGAWLSTRWIPGMPRRRSGIHSMMTFGSSMTFISLVVYIGYNAEKVLIGRIWGADAIGIYSRAYQLVNIPTDNLNSAVGEVAFSALCRLQDDPARFRSYFLKGFSLVIGLTLPATIACALFADDIVFCLLGPKWVDAAVIVRLLAPTIAIFAIINPLGWLIFSIGFVGRGMKAAPVVAAIAITSYVLGLPYGPKGVAFAYSTALMLWVVPHILWCVHGTTISFRDIVREVSRPLAAGILAGGVAFGVRMTVGQFISPWLRLFLECIVLFSTFYGALLFVAGQKSLYLDLLRSLKRPPTIAEKIRVSA